MFELCNKNGVDQIELGLILYNVVGTSAVWFDNVMSFLVSPAFSLSLSEFLDHHQRDNIYFHTISSSAYKNCVRLKNVVDLAFKFLQRLFVPYITW